MKKNIPQIAAGIAALIALISVVSAASLSSKNKAAKAEILALEQQIASMEAYTPAPDKEPEIIYLTQDGDTNEITALKTQLATTEARLEAVRGGTNRPPRQRESFEDRMATMKAEDPEGYAEMIQQRRERQSQMRYSLAERTATFMDLDTSTMNEEELANHEALVAKMARVWELTDQMQDPEAAPDRETMREMFTELRDVRPMMETERNVMFKQLGGDLGYQGEDAEAFATHVEQIIEATSTRIPNMGGRGGGGRGGDRGGGGGGR